LEGSPQSDRNVGLERQSPEQLERTVEVAERLTRDAGRAILSSGAARLPYLLAASPVVLGALLLAFLVVEWGIFDDVESSGTTATAFIVAAVLILVPAILAALRGKDAEEHAAQVFHGFMDVLEPPDPKE
jgi:hypothetical protein